MSEGALILVLSALRREAAGDGRGLLLLPPELSPPPVAGRSAPGGGSPLADLATAAATAAEERDMLRASMAKLERDMLFNEFSVKDAQRDISERDKLLAERDARIAAMQSAQNVLAEQLRELEPMRKRIQHLEQNMFDVVKQKQQLEERIAAQALAMSAAFETQMRRAREAALRELEDHLQRIMVAGQDNPQIVQHVDAARMALTTRLH